MSGLIDPNGKPLNGHQDHKRTGPDAVKEVYNFIADRLGEINMLLGENYRLSIMARHVNMPEGQNADIFISQEGPEEVIAACQRLIDEKAKPTQGGETVENNS